MRVEYAGTIYHVLSRGDRREDIFMKDVDWEDFLKTTAVALDCSAIQPTASRRYDKGIGGD